MRTLYFCPVVSFSIFYLLFSSPNLSRRRLDVYHTSTHCVAFVWIYDAGLKRAAGGSLKYGMQKIAKNRHLGTIALSGYIFATRSHIGIGKKLLNSNISYTDPHNMVNFGPLTAEICWRVCDTPVTPSNFNGFRVLVALLYGTLVPGVSQALRRWTEAPPIFGRAAITLGIGPHSS